MNKIWFISDVTEKTGGDTEEEVRAEDEEKKAGVETEEETIEEENEKRQRKK